MDYRWPDELEALAHDAAAFAATATAEIGIVDDGWLVGQSRAFTARLAERGWIGMTWPTEVGGGARSEVERFVVTEQLVLASAPIATSFFADRQIGPVLLAYGSEAQQQRFLPDICAGRSQWCLGMSEPDAGSNLAGIRTRAERNGDRFVINGQKIWTSGADSADWCYLICRTDPSAPPHKGLSEIVVDMRSPGVMVKPIRDAAGGEHFNEVYFDEVEVPTENLVGQPNNSFKQTMQQLEHERAGIERLASNKRLYLDVRDRVDLSDALLRQDLARIEAGYRVGRDMVLRNVLRQAPYAQYSAVTKTWCTEFEQQVAAFVMRVAGAEATLWNRMAHNAVYAPAYTIMGGTTEVLRNIIGERILGLPREPRVPKPTA